MTHLDLSPIEQARFNMIEQQIRPWYVSDSRVLALLQEVKREDFVPAAHKNLAFADLEIPLGHGASMLSPMVEARLLQDLQLAPHETVLEIGTGSGYMAALLARSTKHVTTVELQPALASQAMLNLAQAVIANVDVKVGDGSQDQMIRGQFDVIVLSGSVAQIPDTLLAKLKVGGRLAAVSGHAPMMRMTIVTCTSSDAQGFTRTEPWDTVAPRLHGFAESARFTF